MTWHVVAVLAGLLVSTCKCTLFEDQKGSNNWLLENVGFVKDASVLSSSPAAVVSTAQGVLASIGLRDGALKWRRYVDSNILIVSEQLESAFVSDGVSLLAWQLQTGMLLWTVPEQADSMCAAGSRIFVIYAGELSCRSSSQGSPVWRTPDAALKGTMSLCHASDKTVLTLAWSIGDMHISVMVVDAETGKPRARVRVSAAHRLGDQVQVNSKAIVALSTDSQHMCSAKREALEEGFVCVDLPPPSGQAVLFAEQSSAAVRTGSSLILFSMVDGTPTQVASLSGIEACSPLFSHNGDVAMAVAHSIASTTAPTLVLSVLSTTTGKELHRNAVSDYPVDEQGRVSQIRAIWAAPAPSTGPAFFR
jgi:hypothetical protein